MKYILISILFVLITNCNKRYDSISNTDDYSLKSYEVNLREYQRDIISKKMQKETEILFKNKFYNYSDFFEKNKLSDLEKESFTIIKDPLEIKSKYKRNARFLIIINKPEN